MATNITRQLEESAPEASLDLERLHRDLVKQLAVDSGYLETTKSFLKTLRDLTNAAAALYFDPFSIPKKTPSAAAIVQPCPFDLSQVPTWLTPALKQVMDEQRVLVLSRQEFEGYSAILAPVNMADGTTHALVVFLLLGEEPLESFVLVLHMIAGHLALASYKRLGEQAAWESEKAASILELAIKIVQARSLREASFILVHETQRHLGCKEVALGVRRRGRFRLEAISGRSEIDRRTDLGRAFESVFQEAFLKGSPTLWSSRSQKPITEAHRKLCLERRATQIYSGTLSDDDDQPQWTWIALADNELPPQAVRFLKAAGPAVVAALRLLDAKGPRSSVSQSGHTWRRRLLIGLLAAAAIAAMWIPVPFHVHSACVVQPVTRRFVAAPFEGTLESTSIRPGDLTTAGQVLAQLEGHELRTQLTEAIAQRASAEKRSEASLAKQEVADSQLSRLEAERLSLKIQLLEHRLSQIEIKSPIAGRVLTGDWTRAIGMPLRLGQTLFQIAPLDRMLIELELSDEDIHHLQVGAAVEMWFESTPESYHGTIQSVRPRAEIRNQANVFVAELELENEAGHLRPGLLGDGRIDAGTRPLGWILFRKPWYSVRRLLWW